MSKHATAFQSASILQPSITKIDNELSTPQITVEFNGTICPPIVSVSGLIDEVESAIDFFDKEKIVEDNIAEDNLGTIKNNPTQFTLVQKSVADKNVENGNIKAVLQNLQKFRNRLASDETNNDVNSTKSLSNLNLDLNYEKSLTQPSDCVVNACAVNDTDIELSGGLISGNLFCNKNWRTKNLSPEEQLLEFSADDVPSFEAVCKSRITADKLSGKKKPENNLITNKNQEIQINNHVSSIINHSMSTPVNSNISNIVTINSEDKSMNVDCLKPANNNEQNNMQNYIRINETENDSNNTPLVLSLFKGEDASVDTYDKINESGDSETKVLPNTELLVTRGLEKSYFKSKLKIPVLNGVNFAAYSGEFVSITGQSGSGKSTLLHLLGTLDKPDSGEIIFDGVRVDNLSVAVRDNLRNNSIGFIFQFYNLLPEFTALENVLAPLMIRESIFGYLLRRRVYIERAKELLDRVGLLHRLRHRPNELSGGEIQRVAIARSLIIEPKLLLADEPTGNLDSASAKEVIRILRELKEERNLTIVMVTHDNSIASTADRVVRMSDGVIT
ncbi:MAG: ABC transporter ATP-binding protein [Planctomycetaceae bacterium]|jgi:lipoprotein-releasing system ATP-binding protein|nr:ABC transporter ATP-binding protein [Planctomycetaceae bacterium]